MDRVMFDASRVPLGSRGGGVNTFACVSVCSGLPAAEDVQHAVREFVDIEGFLQPWRHLERRRVPVTAAVTGDDKKRHCMTEKLIGDRRGVLAAQVTVQQRAIEMVLAYRRNRLFHRGRRLDDFASKLLQHLLDQHGDQELVLHDEDAQAGECVAACRHGVCHVDSSEGFLSQGNLKSACKPSAR